jgi:hypothetical protein
VDAPIVQWPGGACRTVRTAAENGAANTPVRGVDTTAPARVCSAVRTSANADERTPDRVHGRRWQARIGAIDRTNAVDESQRTIGRSA